MYGAIKQNTDVVVLVGIMFTIFDFCNFQQFMYAWVVLCSFTRDIMYANNDKLQTCAHAVGKASCLIYSQILVFYF